MESKGVVVLKFGGSSVETPERMLKVAEYIFSKQKSGFRPAVVISARGDTTDEILELFQKTCPAAPKREVDQALATGEQLSAALLAGALCTVGAKGKSLVAQQMKLKAGGEHGSGRILEFEGTAQMLSEMESGTIPVCAGFQGVRNGDVVTLGRGGSDTTAVALAYALKAAVCEIHTDVDGIYAVDPRIVPNALRFKFISYRDMLDLSSAGAGVLMDRSVMLAQRLNVPIQVILSPSIGKSDGGTLVASRDEAQKNLEEEGLEERTYLAIRRKAAVITVNLANKPGQAAKVFQAVSDIVIGDAIQGKSGRSANISYSVNGEDLPLVTRVIPKGSNVETDCACLTLVSPAMKEGRGYLGRLSGALASARVNIEMLSSSGNSILIVIRDKDVKRAALAVASEFRLC